MNPLIESSAQFKHDAADQPNLSSPKQINQQPAGGQN